MRSCNLYGADTIKIHTRPFIVAKRIYAVEFIYGMAYNELYNWLSKYGMVSEVTQ